MKLLRLEHSLHRVAQLLGQASEDVVQVADQVHLGDEAELDEREVADGVARVHLTGGTVQRRPGSTGQDPKAPLDLGRPDAGQDVQPYLVTIEQDGTWYPSLVFTVTDWMLNRAERERP